MNMNAFFDHGLVKIFFDTVEDHQCMVVASRWAGERRAFALPLEQAFYVRDENTLMEIVKNCVEALGLEDSKAVKYKLADLFLNYLQDLVETPPVDVPDTKKMVEEAVEKHGLKIKVNGEEITP